MGMGLSGDKEKDTHTERESVHTIKDTSTMANMASYR